jgi:hypothetical protein
MPLNMQKDGAGVQPGHEGHAGHDMSKMRKVPGFPADMMDMMGMYSDSEIKKLNKPETRGNLREDWAARHKKLIQRNVLSSLESTEFLQGISLLTSRDRRMKALDQGGESDNAPGISANARKFFGSRCKTIKSGRRL